VVDDEGSNLGGGRKEGGENDDFIMLLYIYRIQPYKSFKGTSISLMCLSMSIGLEGQMWVIITISGEFSLGTLRAFCIASFTILRV